MLYKYPRTFHLPWSPGITQDDKVLKDISHFRGRRIIGTIKKDGENTTMYSDHIHARSLDSKDHESRHWMKSFHASIKRGIPTGWRVCGENLFAQHSIHYDDLESYFYGFSVWDEQNVCLDWVSTLFFFNELGITPVPQLNDFNKVIPVEEIDALFQGSFKDKEEGYVVRLVDEFKYEDFNRSVAKWVRPNHVQTDAHWMHRKVVLNKLK